MDPQRYARVKEVFREAMRWAPEERAAVVAELAGDEVAVRDEVLSLLAHHDEAPLIREAAPAVMRAPGPAPQDPPRTGDVVIEGRTPAELLRAARAEHAGGAAAGWDLERVIRILDPLARELASTADRGVVQGALAASRLDGVEAASAAPEQLAPALGPTGPWTDVYALALLCVELMLGHPATEGSAAAALARTRDEAPQPTPRAVGLDMPAAVEAVMAMALAMRPMERYQDVRRFWTALRESLAASRSPAPALPAASSRPPAGPPSASGTLKLRRRAWPALVAAALAAAAVAAVAAVAISRCG